MKKQNHHKHNFIAVTVAFLVVTIIATASLVFTGQLSIPNLTQMAAINMVDKGERDDIAAAKSTKTAVNKPTTTTKTTTRTERDEDINGKGMNTKITTTVNTIVDTSGNKTTSTAIVSTPVNNKGVPTQPTNTKTTIIKEEPADGSTPKITAVTERVSMEKTDEGFITHTKTTTTDVPTQESTTQFTTSENFTTLEKTDEGFITNKTTITRDDVTGEIVADKTKTTSTIQDTTSSIEKTDDGFIRTNTTITRDANTGNIVDAYSVTSTPTPRPTATPKPAEPESTPSFWDTVADKLNNSEDVLPGLGTNGLGDGNAPVVTPPMSVVTSDNPQDLVNFYKGVGYSMGAGAITAGAILTGGAVIPQVPSIYQRIVSLAGAGGSAITATSLAQATLAYGGAALATLPAAAQATLAYGSSALILGGIAYETNECIKSNDPGSPACVGLVTGYQADPVGFNQALSDSAETLITRPLNKLLDKTVFTGLAGDEYWGGGFSNSGGQTLISRSNMPDNLTPQEQSLWLAKADIVENWNYYQTYGPPSRWTNVGYQPNAAVELYQPSTINQALDNVPDPLGIIRNLEQQSASGATPAELLANSKSFINDKGIITIETPPQTGQWWVEAPNGQGVYWSEGLSQPLSNSTTFGIYRGQNEAVGISAEGTKFVFPSNSSIQLPYTPYQGDAILLNRQALDALGPSKELQTLIHEGGHAVESSFLPKVLSNFWGKNHAGEWVVEQELGAAATEYISTLYGIKAAQALAPTNINMAIDTMTNQLLLNTNIVNPNPSYLLP